MANVNDILKQAGIDEQQITNLGPKILDALGNVLNEANSARDQAEAHRNANVKFYQEQIVPSLNGWTDEKSKMDAELAWHRARTESLKASGLLPDDAPEYPYQPRDGQGRYVASGTGSVGTPGSPTFTGGMTPDQIDQRLGTGISNIGWAMQEYQRLNHELLHDNAPLSESDWSESGP